MRTLSLAALAALVLPLAAPTAAPPGPITPDERAMLVRDLTTAQQEFTAATRGLTEAQWRFKPAPTRWSIAEVAEHIALVEQAIGGQVRGPLLQTPEEEPAADAAAAEGRYRTLMADRSAKFNAPEGFVPSGTWASTDALVAAQVANHTTTLHYVHGTQDALRWHRLPHPALGPMDGVQWLVFMAAHTRRHVQQIEEVKKAEGYPAK